MQDWIDRPFFHSNGRAYKLGIGLPMDMKGVWDLTQLGCCSSNPGFFCTYCDINGPTKHFPSWVRCHRCEEVDPDHTHECFHRPLIDKHTRDCAEALDERR